MNLQCPCCHARFSLETALQDDAARELLWLLADLEPRLARAIAGYLGLFRSKGRALNWDRAGRLAHEVLALTPDREALALALAETTEAIWNKREKEPPRPMSNHNYLKRVLESLTARRPQAPSEPPRIEPVKPAEPEHPDSREPLPERAAHLLARVSKAPPR